MTCGVNPMNKTPEIGRYLDAKEYSRTSDAPAKSGLATDWPEQ